MENETTPALDKYRSHWEDLIAQVEPQKPKMPLSLIWMAVGFAIVGFIYGVGLVILSPLFIPFLFAKQGFEQLEFPWKIKE